MQIKRLYSPLRTGEPKKNDKWEGITIIATKKNHKLIFKNLDGVEIDFI